MKKYLCFFAFCFVSIVVVADDTVVCATKMMRAVYEPLEYTCASGYFLPANTAGCRECPSGHTCEGGTFAFNPSQAQGIVFSKPITQTTNNSCSSNFAHNLVALYQPNTVNLTWDDGTGNTVSTTCEYDGTITLPDIQPTRPGYTFTGWHIKTSN